MKVIINQHQLQLLTNNFVIVEDLGFQQGHSILLTESLKEFKVKVFFGGWESEIRIGASSPSSALAIAKLMFPKAIITSNVTQIK